MCASSIHLVPGDALIVTDVQNDFLPGGLLAVKDGEQIIEPLNEMIRVFLARGLPVCATRDWHPPNHCSFIAQGGPWPPHCIAGTEGAQISRKLDALPASAPMIDKATRPEKEAYSAFLGTGLDAQLKQWGIHRIFLGGLTTEYCILNSVRDAIRLGYVVHVLKDTIRPVNLKPDDGKKAVEEMVKLGAILVTPDLFTRESRKADEKKRTA